MDRNHNSLEAWFESQIPSGSTVLEHGAGDGTRCYPWAAMTNAHHWQFADHRMAAQVQLQAAQASTNLRRQMDVTILNLAIEDPWEVADETSVIVCRNVLHMLRPFQLEALFSGAASLGAKLVACNCTDMLHPQTLKFQIKTLRAGGYVWPVEVLEEIAAEAGLKLSQQVTFVDDESCEIYGPVSGMVFEPKESSN